MRRTILAALVVVLVAAAPAAAARKVPQGWLGVVADGPLTEPDNPFDAEWDAMAGAGAETVRAAVYWSEAQPEAGAPPDFSDVDALVGAAARRRIRVVPVIQRTPSWAAERPGDIASPPRDRAAFAAFMTALVGRYGPAGTFWPSRPELPRVPIRDWQVWNEPNLTRYWSRQPFAPSYVRLLRAAHRAVHRADRGARVILAGLPNESWIALRSIYRAGGRGTFDAVALHPYTGKPKNVVRLVVYARREMRRYRDDGRPVWITELSWPAAQGITENTVGFETTERGQAGRLRSALRRLAAARRRLRIEKVLWYTWLSQEETPNSFGYSGLRRVRDGRLVSAPSLGTFTREAVRLHGCAKVVGDASRCR